MDFVYPDGLDSAQLAVRQAPLDKPLHRAIHGFPTGLESARGFPPTEPARPARQEPHHGAGHRALAVAPGHVLDHDPVLGAVDAPGRIVEIGRNPPQRDEQPTADVQTVVAWRRLLTARTAAADSGMRLDTDLDEIGLVRLSMQADLAIDKADEALHAIQNRLNLQLNG
jgi:hypothetical protein